MPRSTAARAAIGGRRSPHQPLLVQKRATFSPPFLMENPLAPPRVARLRDAIGVLLDHLRYFGLAVGPAPRVKLTVSPRASPADISAFVAADITVRWANYARAQQAGSFGLLPARPSPVNPTAVSAALLVSCRACTLALSAAHLTAAPTADGTPLGLILEGLQPVLSSDGYAIAAATMATRAVWSRVPSWAANPEEAEADARAMEGALAAARAPVPGIPGLPASATAPPRGLRVAAAALPPFVDTDSSRQRGGAGPAGRAGCSSTTSTSCAPRAQSPSTTSSPSWTASSSASFVPSRSASPPPRRRPGRPTKKQSTGRTADAGASAATTDQPSSTTPRRRGRPRKQTTSAAPVADASVGAEADHPSSLAPRRSPGRPRKQTALAGSGARSAPAAASTDEVLSPRLRRRPGRTRKQRSSPMSGAPAAAAIGADKAKPDASELSAGRRHGSGSKRRRTA